MQLRKYFGLHCSLLLMTRWKTSALQPIIDDKMERHDKIFVKEYLTKTRSNLLYKLTSLRKNNAILTSVCGLNGNINYKTISSEKPVYVLMIVGRVIN